MDNNINTITTDIDELVSMIVVGEPRLDEFDSQLFELESDLVSATDVQHLDDCHGRCRRLQGSVSATKNSIESWRDKTNRFFHQLHQLVQDKSIITRYGKQIISVENKITHLLKTFASHIERISQQEEKLVAIHNLVAIRKQDLRPIFEKGKPPSLLDEFEEVAT